MSTSRSPQQSNERWTCRYLESGLIIYGTQIKACCVTHHGNRGHLLLVEEFDGNELPLDAIWQAREDALKRLQEAEGLEPCSECVMLTRRKPTSRRYRFDFINFVNHFECNLRCTYCIPRTRGLHKTLSSVPAFPIAKQLLDRKLLAPQFHIEWSGGEPTMGRDFDQTSTLLAAAGATQALFTNAVILSDAALAWIPSGLTRMHVSVDAGSREMYRRIKGLDAFETVWAHIARYVRAGGRRIFAKMVLLPENRHEVKEFVQHAEDAGVQTVVVDANHFQEDVTDADVIAAAEMLEECARRGIRMQAGFLLLHGRPDDHFHDRVVECHAKRLQDRTVWERLLQHLGTAKGLRHVLRLSRKAFS